MLADQLDYVVGVDPHRDLHALAVVHVLSGAVAMETTVAASSDGYAQALKLVEVHAPGRRAFAVEGTGSFGAGLTRFLTGRGERVLEVSRLRRERRSGGKTDALDALRAARSVLAQERPATPRAGGERQALQALVAAREGAVDAKCAGLGQLRGAHAQARTAAARPARRFDLAGELTLLGGQLQDASGDRAQREHRAAEFWIAGTGGREPADAARDLDRRSGNRG
jgi:transposase